MNEELLAQFDSWIHKADEFDVTYSTSGFYASTSVMTEPEERITLYKGTNGKLNVNMDSRIVPRFYLNLMLDEDVEIEVKEKEFCQKPACHVSFTKNGASLVFQFYMKITK